MANRRFRTYFEMSVGAHPVGRIVFEIRGDVCPATAENWRALCEGDKGRSKTTEVPYHYKGSKLHRVIPDLMLQGGDITRGDGTGGESVWGGTFKDENFILRHTGPGCLSMGNKGPDTNSSIFYICSIKTDWLDEKHVVFGYVSEGMEVVRAIERVGTTSGRPRVDVVIADCGMFFGVKGVPGKADTKKKGKKGKRRPKALTDGTAAGPGAGAGAAGAGSMAGHEESKGKDSSA